jgi:hypothetical protein
MVQTDQMYSFMNQNITSIETCNVSTSQDGFKTIPSSSGFAAKLVGNVA